MLDLKTVKNITISEGSVTKITDSSGVVLWQKVVAPSSSLDVDLNNQWIESTKTLDGYKVYMSNSNHNVNNGYASMKFKFKGMPNFKLWINSYAESNYDYTVAWNLDVNYPTSNPSSSSSGVKAYTTGKQYNPTNITAFTEVDYSNDGGEHFVVVTYRKDSSVNNNDDRGYVAVKLTLISTTWVVSSTEFVKKNDKYYERLNEVGTYEGGITALTGNYKEGNELAVTYKQGTVDDYILVGSGKYYKNYIYVTPKDQEINTGDYIQGDYIGEATPSMKVTYTDGTEKKFYGLSSIEKNTDANKSNAKNVEIYDGVTSIGDNAFKDCYNLLAITIGNSVTGIGNQAFYACSKLTGITIPNSVTSIGENAFYACSGLTSVTIGNGVKTIGGQAFMNCSSLTSITIGNSVTYIGGHAFEGCSKLTGITIPNSVTSIGFDAFSRCKKLESVTIENSTSKIYYTTDLFTGIASTAKLYVPSNLLADYQSDSSWTGAFKGGIFEIQIPAMKVTYTDNSEKIFYNLTSIDENTDSNKSNAKSVEIYDGVTSIGESAFHNCKSLTSVTFPDILTSIGYSAFYGCYALESVTIPANVANIDTMAFGACSGLTNVTIENSSAKLTYNSLAFTGISSTEAILFVPSDLLADYQADSGWTGAFKAGIYAIGTTPTPSVTVICTDNSVKKLYNLTTINSYTNLYKNNAKEVVIGDSITSIGYRPFYSATALTSVIISNSVTSIGAEAFEFCKNLTGITIPDSVTLIGNSAFLGCTIIKSLIFPANLTGIDSKAFQSCYALESVTIKNSNAKLTYWNNAFYGISSSAKLYVPSNLLSKYQSDSNWTGAFKGGIYAIGDSSTNTGGSGLHHGT